MSPIANTIMDPVELPLFPLNTVLFPGGPLPLRIFEPRYLDMVSRCMKNGSGFGVMLIKRGQEAGTAASCHDIGTLAQIIDFDQLQDGLLGITCRGVRRVRAVDKRVQSDQLLIAEVEVLPEPEDIPVAGHFTPLADFLRTLLEHEEIQPYREMIEENWSSADWVGCRLAEILPLPLATKQSLLEISGPEQRLSVLRALLRKNQLL